MINTGQVETWSANPLDLGPLYPFVGWEMPMAGICLAVFAAFMVWKFKSESDKYASQVKRLNGHGVTS